ncbi:MAG: hypothetical protein HYV09_07610 [Deltaproteobacteria bacterium]|nr:hypothetical protein [Deltaproteobacteria bacterium]
MRIGEALVQQGLVTQAQLDAGLRTQQTYGGRLASVLVELGYLDGDLATRALARLRKVPAALKKHFDAAERSVISKVPRRVAEKYLAVPIGWAGEGTLICAMIEPGDLLALEELRFITGTKIVAGLALQVRVRKALERWYGVPADATRGFISASGAQGLPDLESELEQTGHSLPAIQVAAPQTPYRAPAGIELTLDPPPSSRAPAPHSAPPISAPPISAPRTERPLPVPMEPQRTDRPLPVPMEPQRTGRPLPIPTEPPPLPPTGGAGAGGRARSVAPADVPARSVAPASLPARSHPPPLRRDEPEVPPSGSTPRALPHGPPSSPSTRVLLASDALESIAATTSLDERIDVLVSYLRSSFEAAMVFEVRNDIAFGRKAFGPAVRSSNPPRVAMPLTQPSLLLLPYEARTTFFGTPGGEGSELHARLWAALGTLPPREALALPIVIEDKVVALVYAHPRKGERIAPSTLIEVANVCAAIGRRM